MSDTNTQQRAEPSMEEILSSIRRIISEEDGGADSAAAEPSAASHDGEPTIIPEPGQNTDGSYGEPEEAEESEEAQDEVLELTEMVPVEDDEADDEPAAFDNPDTGDDDEADEIELQEIVEADEGLDYEPPPPRRAPSRPAPAEADGDRLLSDASERVSASAFDSLVASMSAQTAIGNGDKTLEQLVKELLRPLLKQWLDTHLPDVVERMVREEIERVAARARRR